MRKWLNLSFLISMVVFAMLLSGCSRARPEENEVKNQTTIIAPSTADGEPTVISVQEAIATSTATPIPLVNTAPLVPATATTISINGNESASASGGETVLPTATPLSIPTTAPVANPSTSKGEIIHIVQNGENLFRMA